MASMNGKIGTVVAPAGDDGRVKVSLEEVNQEIAVMPEKLKNTKIKDDGTKVKKRFWPRRRNKSKLATDNLNLARAQL